MIDENEVENSGSQKRSSMARVTMSQKKVKSKLFSKTKRPFFWLEFQTVNWTNRQEDYPIDNMELISELIKKGMEIDKAI